LFSRTAGICFVHICNYMSLDPRFNNRLSAGFERMSYCVMGIAYCDAGFRVSCHRVHRRHRGKSKIRREKARLQIKGQNLIADYADFADLGDCASVGVCGRDEVPTVLRRSATTQYLGLVTNSRRHKRWRGNLSCIFLIWL
jgi:hypothetical protein